MKKLIVIAILLMFVVPVMAQDEKPTREEQLTQSLLDFKFKLGQEMQISAQQQAQIIQLRKQLITAEKALKEINAKLADTKTPPKKQE